MKDVELPDKPDPVDRYVTDEEFEAVRNLANKRMKVAMDLALSTGLRRGDILALTRDNLTDEGQAQQDQPQERTEEEQQGQEPAV